MLCLRNIIRFVFFILLQVFILDNVPALHRFIIPVIYFLFILWLPFSISRFWLLVVGFLTGLSYDYFTVTPGLHAAACVLVAYFRPFIVNILIPKDTSEFNYNEPSAKGNGLGTLRSVCSGTFVATSWLPVVAGMA
jgi:hypothetical protein